MPIYTVSDKSPIRHDKQMYAPGDDIDLPLELGEAMVNTGDVLPKTGVNYNAPISTPAPTVEIESQPLVIEDAEPKTEAKKRTTKP